MPEVAAYVAFFALPENYANVVKRHIMTADSISHVYIANVSDLIVCSGLKQRRRGMRRAIKHYFR